jgi:tRNA nucleotidyltransferase (CCA-adding enzyme)
MPCSTAPFMRTTGWVVGARPDDLISQGYRAVGKDFPVFLHPTTQEEYALARTERKSGSGHTGFICDFSPDISLEDDLIRRDLTVNAMARDADGSIIDPYGGQRDLTAKILRHVSPAFREDPLRVFRVARFAARYAPLGFRVADDTLQLMQAMCASGELDSLTPERVWKETERALGEEAPDVYLQVLRDCGALALWFPEIERLFGIPQRADYHPEVDSGVHTLMSLRIAMQLSPEARVRFAALVHDLGKADTPANEWPRHIGHEERGVTRVRELSQRLRVPKDFQALGELASRFHLDIHRAVELRPQHGSAQISTDGRVASPGSFCRATVGMRSRCPWPTRPRTTSLCCRRLLARRVGGRKIRCPCRPATTRANGRGLYRCTGAGP